MPQLSTSRQFFSTARAELLAICSREGSKGPAPGKGWAMPEAVCSAVSPTRPTVGPWELLLHPVKPRGTQSRAMALTGTQCAAAAYRGSSSLALGRVPARIAVAVLLVIAHLQTPG